MKKLINDPARVVDDMLAGLVASTNGLALLGGERVVVRSDLETFRASNRVALISGGGGGHEPAHAGYVGEGMLTGAVCGDVFTSPTTDAVLSAIRAVGGPAGTLLIVKNYTGDRLNFGLAAEIARSEGHTVEMVVVADDMSLRDTGENAGRRGIAGTVLVHKVAGAAAAQGLSLDEVVACAQQAIRSVGTMGVALSACTVPAAGRPSFALGDDEVELGLGIHGEAGVEKAAIRPADALVAHLLAQVVDGLGLRSGDRVALLANNLGGTPTMEMNVVAGSLLAAARSHGLEVERVWSGTFLTAIEMAGCSISALRVDESILEGLDAETTAPAWPGRGADPQNGTRAIDVPTSRDTGLTDGPSPPALLPAIRAVAERLIAEEGRLTDLDREVGDGDLGANLARGSQAILAEIETYRNKTPASVLRAVSACVRRSVGGTSGALYAAGLLRASQMLEERGGLVATDWSAALRAGADAIARIGDARVGDRTMLDALLPAADRFEADGGSTLANAVAAAKQGAAATSDISPRRGRSSYLGGRALGIPDPGAEAVAAWLGAVAEATDAAVNR